LPKSGTPVFRADRGEFGIVHDDLVAGKLVRPGFNLRKIVVEPGAGVLRRIAGRGGTRRLWHFHMYLAPVAAVRSQAAYNEFRTRVDANSQRGASN